MRSRALTFLTSGLLSSGLAALALLAVAGPTPTDSRICFGSMKTVVCVPPGETPPSPPQPPTAPAPNPPPTT